MNGYGFTPGGDDLTDESCGHVLTDAGSVALGK